LFGLPDRIDVFYNNQWVGGSGSRIGIDDFPPVSICFDRTDGYVSGDGRIDFNYDPSSSRIVTVYMSGCLGSDTAWDLFVNCPR